MRFSGRTLFRVVVFALVLLSLVALAAKYAIMPNISRYQPEIVSRIASASGMDVTAGAIRGSWRGFRPVIDLENVTFSEPRKSKIAEPGTTALSLSRLTASLSWWSLLAGPLEFGEITLNEPALTLSRRKDGLIYFAGRALNQPSAEKEDGQLLEWLTAQSSVRVAHATLTWQDEITPGPDLKFSDVNLQVDKVGGEHQVGLFATPPVGVAKHVEVRGKFKLDKGGAGWLAVGSVYAAVTEANLEGIRSQLAVPRALQTGVGNARVWIDFDSAAEANKATPISPLALFGPVRAVIADINLINGRAQFADDFAPLNVAKLAGRIQYEAKADGFTATSRGLEFRTREGMVASPADFSLTLLNQHDAKAASGEATGNDIDLKVMAGVLEYFPIGKEVRATFARLGLRGTVKGTRVAWRGYFDAPSAYQMKGDVRDFGMNAQGMVPGVAGLSGSVEGDDKGGKFFIVSKNLNLDAPNFFKDPLKFDSLDSQGNWKLTDEALEIELANAAVSNTDLALNFAGRYVRFRADGPRAKDEKGPGRLDIKGKITRADATKVAGYFPNNIAPTREYVGWAVRGGTIDSADFLINGTVFDFPFHKGVGGKFSVSATLKEVDFRYADGWPQIDNINGVYAIENTKMSGQFTSASILGARLQNTSLAIDDLTQRPGLLMMNSDIEARAETVTRYLKESPLANGVGGFSKFVSIEGPGNLALGLKIKLGEKIETAVDGRYTLSRAQAKPIFGPLISNLGGVIAFNESGLRTTGLAGMAYGNPITLSINGSAETAITTDFTLRADVKSMDDVLPIALPQQITGTTDFVGKIITRKSGTEVNIESSLQGVAMALPFPLAKAADEKRALKVLFTDTAEASEKIRVTLAGNGADQVESRVDARFQRRFDGAGGAANGLFGGIASVGETVAPGVAREGIWFNGTLNKLDFDLWRQAFAGFYPAAAVATPPVTSAARGRNRGSAIAGFDFTLGGLRAYGRDFSAMSLKGRHAQDDWRLTVESAEATGDLLWRPTTFSERGSLRARLKKFVLRDQAILPGATVNSAVADIIEPAADEALPALDVVADEFTFKGAVLGRLDLNAVPQGANWKIERLNITNEHANLAMDGLWQRYGDPARPPGAGVARSRTLMNLKMEANNLDEVLTRFGFKDYVRGGKGSIEGTLSWPGHTYQFATASLSGKLGIYATNGAFEKVNPRAGKLLGLLNMQELQRRVLFDFRDVFSRGYSFDKIQGDVIITNGIMRTDKFIIAGSVADVSMTGEVSLPTEQTNMLITVVPKLDSSFAIGAGVATANPLVGVVVFALQKLIGHPLDKAFGYQLAVTGSWDDPKVDKVSGEPAPPPPPPSAAASAVNVPPQK